MASGNLSYSQIRQLWLQAGGNKAWSYVMAAVAMAESGGNPHAYHLNQNNSVDYGLWQINSIHGYDPQKLYDPAYNAHAAKSVFNSSGPSAWTTYKNGDYLKYMPAGKSSGGSQDIGPYADPVPGAKFGRIDQGVDYVAVAPVKAIAAGTIVGIYHDMAAPNSTRIVEKFDQPIKIANHDTRGGTLSEDTYYYGYYSEEDPLVSKGQHVGIGQSVMKAGSNEIGFLIGAQDPKMPGGPNYPLGAASPPTKEGTQYAELVHKLGGPDPGVRSPGSGSPGGGGGIGNPFSGLFSGIEAALYQGMFIFIGVGLILVGLGLVAWAMMGRVGAPGIIGVVQQQARINQAGERLAESQRASMVREAQANQRIRGQSSQRALQRERLKVQERAVARREYEPTSIAYPTASRRHERTIRNVKTYGRYKST